MKFSMADRKLEPCLHFALGHCKYGASCRNNHSDEAVAMALLLADLDQQPLPTVPLPRHTPSAAVARPPIPVLHRRVADPGVLHRHILPFYRVVRRSSRSPAPRTARESSPVIDVDNMSYEELAEYCDDNRVRVGLKQRQLQLLPVDSVESKLVEPCAVYLSDILPGETLRNLPCAHVFHAECITPWLAESCLCPICKSNVGDELRRGHRRR